MPDAPPDGAADGAAGGETRALARFAAGVDRSSIPADVRARARLVMADTVGAVVGGSTDPAVAALADRVATEPGDTPLIGHPGTTTRGLAAHVNATAGTVLELDEGHELAAGHPAIHVLPALLATVAGDDAAADRALPAFVAGYEAAARVGRACRPLADGYHPHGVWGPVGAAVAVAVTRGTDAATVDRAARIAAKDAQHTLMTTATEGATVRNAFAGAAARAGLTAVDLATAGFRGAPDGVGRHLALATADGVDRAAIDAALGERWEVANGYFKCHAACRYTHPALDATDALADRGLRADDVASIRVETFPAAADLDDPAPSTSLGAKFSLPFAVATRLVTGCSGRLAFVDDALAGRTLALARRVTPVATDGMAARLPGRRSARVVVETHDGRRLAETVDHARGGAERPYDEATIRRKFDDLVAPVVGADDADALWVAVRDPPVEPRLIGELARPNGR